MLHGGARGRLARFGTIADPLNARCWSSLGSAEITAGRTEEAVNAFRVAVEADAMLVSAWLDGAAALRAAGDSASSRDWLRRAHMLAPADPLVHERLVDRARSAALAERDTAILDRRDVIKPPVVPVDWDRLSFLVPRPPIDIPTPADRDRLSTAVDAMRLQADGLPREAAATSFLRSTTFDNFHTAYCGWNDRDIAAGVGGLIDKVARAAFPENAVGPARATVVGRRPRVGFVSGQFHEHSVWWAITESWMNALSAHCELIAYDMLARLDPALTRAFHKRRSGTLDHRKMIAAITEDRPDLLIYPEIGMVGQTRLLASLRLAPVQASTWGHPVTSGLPSIDVFVTGDLLEGEGAGERYTERVECLPDIGTRVRIPTPDEGLDIARHDLSPPGRAPVLLCCQLPAKIDQRYLYLLRDVLVRASDTVLVMVLPETRDPTGSLAVRERLEHVLSTAGIDHRERVRFRDWMSSEAFGGLLSSVDVMLDTTLFSGFNTAVRAIGAGLPIVTLEGDALKQRLASAPLRFIGVTDGVATTVAEYVEQAARLASDRPYRERVRSALSVGRNRLEKDGGFSEALNGLVERLATGRLDS